MTIFVDDREFLEAFRRGERWALEKVYHHYVYTLHDLIRFGSIGSAVGSTRVPGVSEIDAQQELIQEVFVRAFSDRARLAYDGLRPYRPYLLRIARNLLVDRLRRKKPQISLSAIQMAEADEEVVPKELRLAVVGDSPHPEDDLYWKELLAAARSYVAALDDEMREFVRLRFEENRPQRAVAETLGKTRRAVRSMEERVQRKLRKYLKKVDLI